LIWQSSSSSATTPYGSHVHDPAAGFNSEECNRFAMTRTRCCPTTRAYITRRTAEGKTPKEIRRCLKRYIARELYRTLTATMTLTDHPGIAS
jgi:hypothetical protein